MESKIILFHSNEGSLCDDFLSCKLPLIYSQNSKDDIWLCQGMYFWDNRGNANWWNNKQSKKCPSKTYKILKVNACIDDLLDLTDYEVYMKLEKIWKKYCKCTRSDPNVPLGNKLNTMYLAFSDWKETYKIIKVFGKYKFTHNDGIFNFDYNSDMSEPTMAVKCIYNIRDSSCIIEKELLKEENHE